MTEEMIRLKNITEAKEKLSLPEVISPGLDGDAAYAAVVRLVLEISYVIFIGFLYE